MSGKKSKSKPTLSDKISALLTVAPSADPEDDIYKETKAKTVEFDGSDYDNDSDIDIALSSIRKQNAKLLEDQDKKYRGKTVSRKDLGLQKSESEVSSDSDLDDFSEQEVDSDEDIESESNKSKNNSKNKVNKTNGTLRNELEYLSNESDSEETDNSEDYDSDSHESKPSKLGKFVKLPKNYSNLEDSDTDENSNDEEGPFSDGSDDLNEGADKTNKRKRSLSKSSSDDDSQDEENDGSDDSDEDEDEDFGDDSIIQKESTFNHMKTKDMSEEIQKGNCVQQQLNLFENLLELRIHTQKLLLSANKLPAHDDMKEYRKAAGTDFVNSLNTTRNNISNVLDKFLNLQQELTKRFPETKNLEKGEEKNDKVDDMDEEIPSDTEDEDMDDSEAENKEAPPAKKRKISDYSSIIKERHSKYVPYRNSVIQKWHDKTRIASGNLKNNNASSGSLISHIEFVLNDKDRLRRRTQLKRSNYEILGAAQKIEENDTKTEDIVKEKINGEDVPENATVTAKETYNSEIFDDDDFYHQLLRELIECKSSDPHMSKQWIELQQLKNKMKRKIDTRATKGRKIRYVVHSKLVNYMAPENNCTWTDEAKDELFSSLFGNRKNITVVETN